MLAACLGAAISFQSLSAIIMPRNLQTPIPLT